MSLYIEEIREKLNEYHISKISLLKKEEENAEFLIMSTPEGDEIISEFLNYLFNLEGVLYLYGDICNIYDCKNYFQKNQLEYYSKCSLIILALMTAYESFLNEMFKTLISNHSVEQINIESLKKFVRKFPTKNKDKIIDIIENNPKIKCACVLPRRISLQNPYFGKLAYKIFNIRLPEIDKKCWDNICNKKSGYLTIRHKTAHIKPYFIFIKAHPVLPEFLEQAILDVSKFVYRLRARLLELDFFKEGEYVTIK